MQNQDPNLEHKQIAITLAQIVNAHTFQGSQSELVTRMKQWLKAVAQEELVLLTPAQILEMQTEEPVEDAPASS